MESARKCPTCGRRYGRRRRCYACNGQTRRGAVRPCPNCGRDVYATVAQLYGLKHGGTYCSPECSQAARRGRVLRTGNTYLHRDGYVRIYMGLDQWKLEHRVIMERHLGRPLGANEQVHHINHDRADNRIENLQLVSPIEHGALHREPVTLTCERCGKSYATVPSRAGQSRYCSRECHNAARRRQRTVVCARCGRAFTTKASVAARGRAYCSLACRRAAPA